MFKTAVLDGKRERAYNGGGRKGQDGGPAHVGVLGFVTMIDLQCKEVLRRLGVRTLVETGTDMAETVAEVSRWFSGWDPDFGRITDTVETGARSYRAGSQRICYPQFEGAGDSRYAIHSVDLDSHSYNAARKLFESNPNIALHHESSEAFLRRFVEQILESRIEDGVFFFLDAHWGKYWPLRDELRQILRLERCVVCIDDFFVPGKSNPSKPHGDFGFDVYQSTVLDWGYVRDALEDRRVKVAYPTRSNRDGRGWVLIFAGYSDEELASLDWTELFALDADDPVHSTPTKLHPLAFLDTRNLVKRIVPLALLRSTVRLYQRLM